jgi:hypothetical protein
MKETSLFMRTAQVPDIPSDRSMAEWHKWEHARKTGKITARACEEALIFRERQVAVKGEEALTLPPPFHPRLAKLRITAYRGEIHRLSSSELRLS